MTTGEAQVPVVATVTRRFYGLRWQVRDATGGAIIVLGDGSWRPGDRVVVVGGRIVARAGGEVQVQQFCV